MSDGDLSGMDSDVVEESVVAIDAVVASSNDGGVQGRRSGRPEEDTEECVSMVTSSQRLHIWIVFIKEGESCQTSQHSVNI